MAHPLSSIIEDHYKRMEDGDFINVESNWFSYDITFNEDIQFKGNYLTVYSKEVKERDVISTFNLNHITLVRFVKKEEAKE